MSKDIGMWVAAYLGLGIAFILASRLMFKHFQKNKQSDFVRNAIAALEEEKSPQEKRRRFFKEMATNSLILMVWPVGIAVLVSELRSKPRPNAKEETEPTFTCKKKDLVEIVNPLEIEAQSRIDDPLGRVPDLPFGHLNQGWKSMRAELRPGDVMWSFNTGVSQNENLDAKTSNQRRKDHGVEGYAIVRNRKIVAEFFTHWG